MNHDMDWNPFFARVALLPEPHSLDKALDLQRAEAEVKSIVEGEGGKVINFYWHLAFSELYIMSHTMRMIMLFDARSQYPIWIDGEINLDMYVHKPQGEGMVNPEAIDPAEMAEAIRAKINKSSRFLVVDMESWSRREDMRIVQEREMEDVSADSAIARIGFPSLEQQE